VAYTGRLDSDSLTAAVQAVFDRGGTGRVRGPIQAPLRTETYVRVLEARVEALAHLPELTDEELDQARLIYRAARCGYEAEIPHLSADPQLGKLFSADVSDEVNGVCVSLITILGFERIGARNRELLDNSP
jgi:hypothetical protein